MLLELTYICRECGEIIKRLQNIAYNEELPYEIAIPCKKLSNFNTIADLIDIRKI